MSNAMSSNFCSRCGASIQADANFCHACGARIQKSEVPPSQSAGRELPSPSLRESVAQEKQNKETELTTDQRRVLEGKRPLSKSYIARHWRGELSLPRSFWVNGVLLSVGLLLALIMLTDTARVVMRTNIHTGIAFLFASYTVFWIGFVAAIWQSVGLSRSATRYSGSPVLEVFVKAIIGLAWLLFFIKVPKVIPETVAISTAAV